MIIVTGSNSGIGAGVVQVLTQEGHDVRGVTRTEFDMDYQNNNIDFSFLEGVDTLINCAGHDLGGKVDFINHDYSSWLKIMNTNLINTMTLTHKVLNMNKNAIIVNITSTNVDQYYPNDLVYSLSKTALSTFTSYLRTEYPAQKGQFKEVRLGLTKTNFVNNRYKNNHAPRIELYDKWPHLSVSEAAREIVGFLHTDLDFVRIQAYEP